MSTVDSTAPEVINPGPLYMKLAHIMGNVGPVAAKGRNDFLKTSYVEEADLFDAIRDLLAKHNVAFLPATVSVSERPAKSGSRDTTLSTVTYEFTFCDGETGATHTLRWIGAGEDPGDKGTTKAATNAVRTFLLKAFMVSSAETNAASVPGAGVAPTSGGTQITQEQVDGLSAAFKAAGQPIDKLTEFLDGMNVVKERDGVFLALPDRIGTLNTTEAIKLHKLVAALPKAV